MSSDPTPTLRDALRGLLATCVRCHHQGCKDAAVYGGQYGWMTCEAHSGTDRIRTPKSAAIEAAERALAAPAPPLADITKLRTLLAEFDASDAWSGPLDNVVSEARRLCEWATERPTVTIERREDTDGVCWYVSWPNAGFYLESDEAVLGVESIAEAIGARVIRR